jgi:hypothetical protein
MRDGNYLSQDLTLACKIFHAVSIARSMRGRTEHLDAHRDNPVRCGLNPREA